MAAPAIDTQATSAADATPEQEIQARIESLQTNLKAYMDSQKTVMKEMVSAIGNIQKLFAKSVRSNKGKSRRRVSNPQRYELDSKTAKGINKLGLEGNTFSRSDLMKGISAYIREHKLQNADKKTVWLADATIAKVLNVAKGSENSYLQINQLITPLLKDATKVAPAAATSD